MPMTYEGDILNLCPRDIDFTNTWAVVVSGASWNPCGHMLFCCGTNSDDSWYLHVAGQGVREVLGVWAYPKFMRGDANFYRYLADNGKREIRRIDVRMTNPSGAYTALMKYMADKWFWRVLPNNCVTFTRDLVVAGGGTLAVPLNCPDQEFVRRLKKAGRAALEAESNVPPGFYF